jgi:uncharacterized protein YlaN (UPF0358 family)
VTSLIAIRIPEDIASAVLSFCHMYRCVPAQNTVTLIAPPLLERAAGLEQKLQAFCLAQADFTVALRGAESTDGKHIFLRVQPGVVNMVQSRLAAHLKVDVSGAQYRPHLNILQYGADEPRAQAFIMDEARRYFARPYNFTVSSLGLYEQREDDGLFTLKAEIPFTGRPI